MIKEILEGKNEKIFDKLYSDAESKLNEIQKRLKEAKKQERLQNSTEGEVEFAYKDIRDLLIPHLDDILIDFTP